LDKRYLILVIKSNISRRCQNKLKAKGSLWLTGKLIAGKSEGGVNGDLTLTEFQVSAISPRSTEIDDMF
jgi:hypothetical protein